MLNQLKKPNNKNTFKNSETNCIQNAIKIKNKTKQNTNIQMFILNRGNYETF